MKILYHHRTQRKLVEGVHISGVINGLLKLGHSVFELSLVKDSNAGKEAEKNNDDKKVSFISGIFQKFAKNAPNILFRIAEIGYNFIAIIKFFKIILKEKPDIIYERYAYFNFSGVLVSKVLNVPLILEVNIVSEMQDTRAMALSWMALIIEKWVLSSASAITVVSDYLKDILLNEGITRPIFVQPNAFSIDLAVEEITPANIQKETYDFVNHKNENNIVIGFIGGLGKWYKLDSLIKVFNSLSSELPELRLIFIGDGILKRDLEAMVAHYSLIDKVHFCGRLARPQALALLKICDIGVIPSTNLWGSPMKLFEYMGMGLPVVAPDIKVITSIMKDGIHGRNFKYDDFNDLKAMLKSLIIDHDLRVKMGRQARNHILLNHTWDNVAKNVESIAFNLLESS